MNANIIPEPRPREQIGYIEEYSVKNAEGYYDFAGTLKFLGQKSEQTLGAAAAIYYTLKEDLTIGRGMSRQVKLKKGTEVCRRVYPLEGRAL